MKKAVLAARDEAGMVDEPVRVDAVDRALEDGSVVSALEAAVAFGEQVDGPIELCREFDELGFVQCQVDVAEPDFLRRPHADVGIEDNEMVGEFSR